MARQGGPAYVGASAEQIDTDPIPASGLLLSAVEQARPGGGGGGDGITFGDDYEVDAAAHAGVIVFEDEYEGDAAARAGATSAARHALYCSHALSTWGQRMWEFAVGLVLLQLYPDRLSMVAASGLVMSLGQAVLGPQVGAYMDRTPRLRAAIIMYVVQNAAVAASAACGLAMLWLPGIGRGVRIALATAFIAGAAVSDLGALGCTLAVEKEWVKLLAGGCTTQLARTNAAMKRIDLTCLLMSPALVGVLMTYAGTAPATLLICCYNLVAWVPECLLLSYAQRVAPELSCPKAAPQERPGMLSKLAGGWPCYLRQRCLPAALALALLYFTVLSFGLLMTAYLKWHGLSEVAISGARGAGALAGLAATVVYPPMQARVGILTTGTASIAFQWAALSAVMAAAIPSALALVPNRAAEYAMIGGLVLSRFGLWSFDLAVSQLLQEWVADKDLGAVNGVQGSLQQLSQLCMYALGVAFGAPSQFVWLMATSWVAVTCAGILYCLWASRYVRIFFWKDEE